MNTITESQVDRFAGTKLLVRRTGIRFCNVERDRVSIEIEVENRSDARSEPTLVRLEAAPFGAFVRWRPLATIPVPAISPRGTAVVQTVVRQPRPKPIGSFSGLIPPSLLTAAAFGPDRRRATPGPDGVPAFQASLVMALMCQRRGSSELPPDLLDLLDGPHPHWAGNLNVWIGSKAVERHMAPRLRIHSGRANLAVFCLGDKPDQYAFSLEGPDEDWGYALFDMLTRKSVSWSLCHEPVTSWHALPEMHPFLLVLRPPEACERGAVLVHVTQRSSRKTAAVEFDLDPTAVGPGCYAV